MNKIICYYIGKGLDIMNVTVLCKNILLDNTKYKKTTVRFVRELLVKLVRMKFKISFVIKINGILRDILCKKLEDLI